jgi:hypothetical protein
MKGLLAGAGAVLLAGAVTARVGDDQAVGAETATVESWGLRFGDVEEHADGTDGATGGS